MRNINCTSEERKLLNLLRSKKNEDGFYELLLMDYEQNNKLFYKNFDDDVIKTIKEIEIESICIYRNSRTLPKRFQAISQLSIKERVTDETASYTFLKNVAYVADYNWLKPLLKEKPKKKVFILYFFKKFENCMEKPLQSKTKLLKEYQAYAKTNYYESLRLLVSQKETNLQKILETLIKSF